MHKIPVALQEEDKKITSQVLRILESMTDEEFESTPNFIEKWIEEHASDEMKAELEYFGMCVGDEGEILDGNGNKILDEEGFCIQDWSADDENYVVNNQTGKRILLEDGSFLPAPKMKECLKKLYELEDEG